jgi:AhpD family alkylhydroperoxidase
MENRFDIKAVFPASFEGMYALQKQVGATEIDPIRKELIKIRASQINGCAYCLNRHIREAKKYGETQQRIDLLAVWREASVYTEEERLVLEMTEEITLLHRHGLSDAVYRQAIDIFGESKTAQLIMLIVIINAWNRIMGSLHAPLD